MNQLKLSQFGRPVNFPKLESAVLDYWDQTGAFRRSVSERPEDKPFVFYDGPPFATGLPHYGHLLGSVMKDIIPRYWTMKGFRVERRWGWDCHGLPIENMIEQELGLTGGKKGIEAYGINNFNQACRSAILRFDQEWAKIIRRVGRWVDMDHSYKTMDLGYMESVWWAFKQLYDKKLVYQGRKVILYCPRCSTPLSNFEIAMDNSYKDISETATIYKFPVKGKKQTYLLAWSTTPWNKLATPALGVNPTLTYVKVRQGKEFYILAQTTLNMLQGEYSVLEKFSGQDLADLKFDLLYDFYPDRNGKRAGVIIADEFVTADEGTGIVTLAVYGEDDYRVMLAHKVQLIEHVDEQGKLKPEVTPWAGMDILKANPLIDADLEKRGLIYNISPYSHSVPTCYRCSSRLYYAPLPAWFIDIQKLKPNLVKHNQTVNWYPAHLKQGRFGKGLVDAPDWNISRSRYWGTPMPVWVGTKTKTLRVIGSVAELKKWALNPEKLEGLADLHRESVDQLEVYVDDAKTEVGHKIPEVFDCWVESGSMSFAAEHYPFENKANFEARFPAQYICEYIAQTRAWFYTLHVMAVALFDKPAFQNALTTGTIMAQDGTKMSKSKKNYPDPMVIIDRYGVDALRLYFASSPLMKTAQNVNFSEPAIDDIRKKSLNLVVNVLQFYLLFDQGPVKYGYPVSPQSVLDQWLISKIQSLIQTCTKALDHYDVVTASRHLMDFVQDLSTWYLRRSRDRLRQPDLDSLQVIRTVLRDWSLLIAPLAPFIAEVVYQNLPGAKTDSVHLELWPKFNPELIQPDLETAMAEIRAAAVKIHAQRQAGALPVKQPLNHAEVISALAPPSAPLRQILAEEVNVKQVSWHPGPSLSVNLDTTLTPELKAEGQAREFIRRVMDQRKAMGTQIDEFIIVEAPAWPEAFTGLIKAKVRASELRQGPTFKILRQS